MQFANVVSEVDELARGGVEGADGVEVGSALRTKTFGNVTSPGPGGEKMVRGADPTGIRICCVRSEVTFSGQRRPDAEAGEALGREIEAVAAMGCGRLCIVASGVGRGSVGSTALAMAAWLGPLADRAAERGVTLLVENGAALPRAKDLWRLQELAATPAVEICWNLWEGLRWGEDAVTAVSVLNRRLQYVRLDGGLWETPTGVETVRQFLRRLQGIGYGGWVTVDLPPGPAAKAIAQMRGWVSPQHGEKDSDVLRDWRSAHPGAAAARPGAHRSAAKSSANPAKLAATPAAASTPEPSK